MYAKIAVLTYQTPQISTYTYQIPKDYDAEIKIGQLVNVPFGKRNPYGIVLEIEKNLSPAEQNQKLTIKSINSIVLKKPILLPHQLKLANQMSEYYHAPISKCLEAMTPEIPRKNYDFQKTIPVSKITKQTIVLVPSINQIPQTTAMFKTKNFVVYHSELRPDERFDAWQKIKGGYYDYIFGTRSAIFTPCPNLKEIIIFDEHNNAYKDQRSPYFDTLTIAQMLGKQEVDLKIIDPSPKVATYFAHKSQIKFHFEGIQKRQDAKVKIVSMADEKNAGNKLPISDLLQNYIKLGSQKDKRILLFLNKKAQSGHVYCKTCKYSDFAKSEPERCPSCQSSDIFFNSTNVKSLSTLVKKLVPSISINIIASTKKSFAQTPANTNQKTLDIATALVFYKLHNLKYDLVAHIYTDALLNITDFTSAEKLYTQITNLKKITKGLLLLQTYNPQDETIQNAASGNFQKFYNDQLSQRKALSYPPFALLVKLTIKGKKEQNLEQKAQTIFELLTSGQSKTQQASILGPFKPVFSGNVSKYNIIIKVPVPSYTLEEKEKAINNIAPLLSKVPGDWQITAEPEDLN